MVENWEWKGGARLVFLDGGGGGSGDEAR